MSIPEISRAKPKMIKPPSEVKVRRDNLLMGKMPELVDSVIREFGEELSPGQREKLQRLKEKGTLKELMAVFDIAGKDVDEGSAVSRSAVGKVVKAELQPQLGRQSSEDEQQYRKWWARLGRLIAGKVDSSYYQKRAQFQQEFKLKNLQKAVPQADYPLSVYIARERQGIDLPDRLEWLRKGEIPVEDLKNDQELILAVKPEDLSTVITRQANPEQFVTEIIDNAKDAMGVGGESIGRFGIGFMTTLAWVRTRYDALNVLSFTENGGLRGEVRTDGQEYYLKAKESTDYLTESAEIAARFGDQFTPKTGSIISLRTKLSTREQQAFSEEIKYRFTSTTGAIIKLDFNGVQEEINGLSDLTDLHGRSQTHTDKVIYVAISDSGITFMDSGKGIDPEIFYRKLFIPNRSTKDEGFVTDELAETKPAELLVNRTVRPPTEQEMIGSNATLSKPLVRLQVGGKNIETLELPDQLNLPWEAVLVLPSYVTLNESKTSVAKDAKFWESLALTIARIEAEWVNPEQKLRYLNLLMSLVREIVKIAGSASLESMEAETHFRAKLQSITFNLCNDLKYLGYTIYPNARGYQYFAAEDSEKVVFINPEILPPRELIGNRAKEWQPVAGSPVRQVRLVPFRKQSVDRFTDILFIDGETAYFDTGTYNHLIQTVEGREILNLILNPIDTSYDSPSNLNGEQKQKYGHFKDPVELKKRKSANPKPAKVEIGNDSFDPEKILPSVAGAASGYVEKHRYTDEKMIEYTAKLSEQYEKAVKCFQEGNALEAIQALDEMLRRMKGQASYDLSFQQVAANREFALKGFQLAESQSGTITDLIPNLIDRGLDEYGWATDELMEIVVKMFKGLDVRNDLDRKVMLEGLVRIFGRINLQTFQPYCLELLGVAEKALVAVGDNLNDDDSSYVVLMVRKILHNYHFRYGQNKELIHRAFRLLTPTVLAGSTELVDIGWTILVGDYYDNFDTDRYEMLWEFYVYLSEGPLSQNNRELLRILFSVCDNTRAFRLDDPYIWQFTEGLLTTAETVFENNKLFEADENMRVIHNFLQALLRHSYFDPNKTEHTAMLSRIRELLLRIIKNYNGYQTVFPQVYVQVFGLKPEVFRELHNVEEKHLGQLQMIDSYNQPYVSEDVEQLSPENQTKLEILAEIMGVNYEDILEALSFKGQFYPELLEGLVLERGFNQAANLANFKRDSDWYIEENYYIFNFLELLRSGIFARYPALLQSRVLFLFAYWMNQSEDIPFFAERLATLDSLSNKQLVAIWEKYEVLSGEAKNKEFLLDNLISLARRLNENSNFFESKLYSVLDLDTVSPDVRGLVNVLLEAEASVLEVAEPTEIQELPEPVDVAEVIAAYQKSLDPLNSDRSMLTDVERKDANKLIAKAVTAQSSRRDVWIRELIQNARDASKGKQSRIGISTTELNGQLLVTISDNGKGMNLEDMYHKLLQPHVRDQEKVLDPDSAGGFGWGFWTALENSEYVEVISVKQGLQTRLRLVSVRDSAGKVVGAKITHQDETEVNPETSSGTKINVLMLPDTLPSTIQAQMVSNAVSLYAKPLVGETTRIDFNEQEVPGLTSTVLAEVAWEGQPIKIGVTKRSEDGWQRVTQHKIFLGDVEHGEFDMLAYVPLPIREVLQKYGWNLQVDLPPNILPSRDRNTLSVSAHEFDLIKKIVATAIWRFAAEQFVQGNMAISVMPDDALNSPNYNPTEYAVNWRARMLSLINGGVTRESAAELNDSLFVLPYQSQSEFFKQMNAGDFVFHVLMQTPMNNGKTMADLRQTLTDDRTYEGQKSAEEIAGELKVSRHLVNQSKRFIGMWREDAAAKEIDPAEYTDALDFFRSIQDLIGIPNPPLSIKIVSTKNGFCRTSYSAGLKGPLKIELCMPGLDFRLKKSRDEWTVEDWHELTDLMVHELVHAIEGLISSGSVDVLDNLLKFLSIRATVGISSNDVEVWKQDCERRLSILRRMSGLSLLGADNYFPTHVADHGSVFGLVYKTILKMIARAQTMTLPKAA